MTRLKVPRRMRIFFAAATLAVAGPAFSQAAGEQLTKTLVGLEEERLRAYVDGDRATLERQLAVEYNHTNLRGATTNRDQEIAFYAPGVFSLRRGTIDGVSVRRYGDVAVLLGTVTWEGAAIRPAAGVSVDLSGRYQITRVYAMRSGRWQVVASHASMITPAQAPAPTPPQAPPQGSSLGPSAAAFVSSLP